MQNQFDKNRDFQVETTDNISDIKAYVHQTIRDFEDWDDDAASLNTREMVAKSLIEDRLDSRPM